MPPALLVTSSFLPGKGGIETYLAELCEELAPRLAVLAPAERDGQGIPGDLPYPALGYPGSMLIPSSSVSSAVLVAARAVGADRILFGTPWPLALLGPRLAAAGLRYSVVVHGAEILVPSAVPGIGRKLRGALAGADVLLPVSETTRARLLDFVGRGGGATPPTPVLRPRVDPDRFSPERRDETLRARYGLAHDARVILCFGRLVRRKGVDRVLRVLDRIADVVGEVAVVIAGSGPERARLERVARSVRSRVIFAGRVDHDLAPAVYAAADVFVLPARDRWGGLDTEGLGVVLLEAAASGVPCVTGVSGGTVEAVVDGRTGFVVDADDDEALVDRIAWLLNHREEAAGMGREGREFVIRRFAQRPLPRMLVDWLGVQEG